MVCGDRHTKVVMMQGSDIRAALAQNQANQDTSALGFLGLIALAVFSGVWWQSWVIGLGAFFGPLLLLSLPGLGQFVAMALAALWAYLGYKVGHWFGGGWTYGLPIFFGLFGFGVYLSTGQYLKDLSINLDDSPKSAKGPDGETLSTSSRRESLSSIFRSDQGDAPNPDIPKPDMIVAALLVLGFFALSMSLLASVFIKPVQLDATSVNLASPTPAETLPTPTAEDKPRTVTLANPDPRSYRPREEPLRTHMSPSDITVSEWNRITRKSQILIAEKWVKKAFPSMRSTSGNSYFEHYSRELAECVDTTVSNMDELGENFAAQYAAACIIILGN